MIKKNELKQKVYGPYVATPIQNAFNDKVAYWLSKKDCMLSLYMFSVDLNMVKSELKEKLSKDSVLSYVLLLEERLVRARNDGLYTDLCKVADSGFDWVNYDIYDEVVLHRDYPDAVKNLDSMIDFYGKDCEELTWQQLGEFLGIHKPAEIKSVMGKLRDGGYISYTEVKNGVRNLKILKQM